MMLLYNVKDVTRCFDALCNYVPSFRAFSSVVVQPVFYLHDLLHAVHNDNIENLLNTKLQSFNKMPHLLCSVCHILFKTAIKQSVKKLTEVHQKNNMEVHQKNC